MIAGSIATRGIAEIGGTMTTLRATVIAKTDIVAYTARVTTLPEADLRALQNEHKLFVSTIVAKNGGTIIRGEGDAFWMLFPSVTAAALTAIELHQELRLLQTGKGDAERVAIRIAITLGDVLHHDQDIFGDVVNLTARIEAITPPDEIYLSQAAWLALNKAEVQTSFVNEFILKGMQYPEKVYRIDQHFKTRIVKDQIIVFTDIRGFTPYQQSHSIEDIEQVLTNLDELEKRACEQHGGIIRLILGDSYFLTFAEASQALASIENLCQGWNIFQRQYDLPCGLSIGIHKGDLYIFRSYIYSEDIDITARIEAFNRLLQPERPPSAVTVSEKVQAELTGTLWDAKRQRVDQDKISDSQYRTFLETHPVYQLVIAHNEAENADSYSI
jgi:class 3 adenylate cyclase